MIEWTKKIICQLIGILTFVWAAKILFTLETLNQIENSILVNDLFKIIFIIALIIGGFWSLKKCPDNKCTE